MIDGSAYEGEVGYPLSDATLIIFADSLIELGCDPKTAKDIAEARDVRMALGQELPIAGEVWPALVIWSDPDLDASLLVGTNALQAVKRAGDHIAEVGFEKVANIRVFNMTERLVRLRSAISKLAA